MRQKSKMIVALAAICALGAAPTASASAAEAHWYIGGTRLVENTQTAITATGTGTSELSATIATVSIKITCTAMMSIAGTILNPTGGGMGTATRITLVFSGCTVDPMGQHCSVRGVPGEDPIGTITTFTLKATAEAGMKATFSPTSGATEFVEIELSGCATGGLSKKYKVTGSATGVESPTGSGKLVFNSALELGGIAATFANATDVTAGASAVTIEEP